MADDFERFLASALAPPPRIPDRDFVARVQAAVVLEEQLALRRRALAGSFLKQLAALFAVAAAVGWIGRADPIAGAFAEFPALGLAVVLSGFALLVGLLSLRSGPYEESYAQW